MNQRIEIFFGSKTQSSLAGSPDKRMRERRKSEEEVEVMLVVETKMGSLQEESSGSEKVERVKVCYHTPFFSLPVE